MGSYSRYRTINNMIKLPESKRSLFVWTQSGETRLLWSGVIQPMAYKFVGLSSRTDWEGAQQW